jgi:hypothetical protein
MKYSLCLILLVFGISKTVASEIIEPCPKDRSALCREANFLAQKIREESTKIGDIAIHVDADRWTILYREISNKPLTNTTPEAFTGWAFKVQRSWCLLEPITDFVNRGGEFFYRIETGAGEAITPTLILKCPRAIKQRVIIR